LFLERLRRLVASMPLNNQPSIVQMGRHVLLRVSLLSRLKDG
jgi:hypothetical protein